jgi:hypothetical protein
VRAHGRLVLVSKVGILVDKDNLFNSLSAIDC